MTDQMKLSIKGVWLIASISTVVLPIFLPSVRDGSLAGNPIALATVSMFFLSLPSSMLALPLSDFLRFLFGINSWSIGGMYLNVLVLFVLGLLQWFWIVPRILRSQPMLQQLKLGEAGVDFIPADMADCDRGRLHEATPVERIIKDN